MRYVIFLRFTYCAVSGHKWFIAVKLHKTLHFYLKIQKVLWLLSLPRPCPQWRGHPSLHPTPWWPLVTWPSVLFGKLAF